MSIFTNKVVLVTGGSSGIGQATALAFAREGATVVIAGRRAHEGEKAVALLREPGTQSLFIQADVTREAEVARLLEQIVARYGRIDIAFNNAGILGSRGAVAELSEQEWDTTIEGNLKGTWLCMKYEIQHMLRQGGGSIINMGSNIGVHTARPMLGAYAVAKAGVQTLTKVAALEYIQSNIRINVVSPGPVRTSMSKAPTETDEERDQRVASTLPIGRVAQPEEVAAAVLWLSSPQSSFLVGHDIVLDGGFSLQ